MTELRHAHRWFVPCAALVAVAPLLVHGPSCGHDFDFHLLSWLEAATQLTHGAFPHWAYTPAWNAGEPRFLFYPPLSWLLGALLGLVLPWTLVPAALTWLCLTLSGFSMHRFASSRLAPGNALLAATLYLANPYMLFTAYERTAYGELLAAAFVPLLFAVLLAPRLRALPLAGCVALIWLANAPAGVMCCYAVAFVAACRIIPQVRIAPRPARSFALATTGGTLLGLALAGAYLVPAIYEQRFISASLATVEGMRIEDNTLFHHMRATTATSPADAALHNQVLATASGIAVLLIAGVLIATLQLRRFRRPRLSPINPLLLLVVLVLLLMTPAALPVWHLLPELRFLQFPWRLLVLVAPAFALYVAATLPNLQRPRGNLALAGALTLALVLPAWRLFQQPCDDEDAVPARVALFHSNLGTDPTDEYTPADADPDALANGDPPYWLVAPSAINTPAPQGAHPGQAPAALHLHLTRPEVLVLNRRAYPLWQLHLNGRVVAPGPQERTDGLLTLALPAGDDTVTLTEARTPDENAGLALSLSAGALALTLWRNKRQNATSATSPAEFAK